MSVEYIIVAGLVVLGVSMMFKYRSKPVDMNHKAPNVHNVQMKGKVGPATAADKPAPAAKATKKTTKKKTTKKTAKKTSKKTASKK
jgi:hypothetical protein